MSVTRMEFEAMILMSEGAKTFRASDRVVTMIGRIHVTQQNLVLIQTMPLQQISSVSVPCNKRQITGK
jgi:hypothetical protein